MPSQVTGKSEVKSIVPFPPYNYRIYLIFTKDLIKTADNLAKQGFITKNHGIDDTTGGYCVRMPNQSFAFVVLKTDADVKTITHECYHAVCAMFNWIGARHEEEMFAYHLGYLVGLAVKDQEKAKKDLTKVEN